MNHLCQPIERGIGITATHRFDEGRYRVVVRITIAVVNNGFLLNAFLRHRQVDMDESILSRRGRQRRDLE